MWQAAMLVVCGCVAANQARDTCSQALSRQCGAPFKQGLNSTDVAAILRRHNELRNKLAAGEEKRGGPGPQPAASNMRALVWDQGMARLAQNWANQCVFGHDLCGGDTRFTVGQNVFSSMSSEPSRMDWRVPVDSWYDEVQHFNHKHVSSFRFSTDTGHYTQLAWAATEMVGCGYVGHSKGGWHRHTLVCNYAPAGNVLGQPVYKSRGEPCSACRSCHPSYRALCG